MGRSLTALLGCTSGAVQPGQWERHKQSGRAFKRGLGRGFGSKGSFHTSTLGGPATPLGGHLSSWQNHSGWWSLSGIRGRAMQLKAVSVNIAMHDPCQDMQPRLKWRTVEKTTTSVNSSVFSLPCWIHVAMLAESPACRASSEVGQPERPRNAVRGGSVLHCDATLGDTRREEH